MLDDRHLRFITVRSIGSKDQNEARWIVCNFVKGIMK